MRLVRFTVKNYKSFADSGASGELSAGINVIVGQNNAGKTALLEALTLRGSQTPHRSLRTHPHRGAVVGTRATTIVEIAFSPDELFGFIADNGGHFVLPVENGRHAIAEKDLRLIMQPELLVQIIRPHAEGMVGNLPKYKMSGNAAHFDVQRPDLELRAVQGGSTTQLGQVLADAMPRRMYLFGAERFRVGESGFGSNEVLASDAHNLPEVLNRLQANRDLFADFNALVHRVLPQVQWVSVEPRQDNKLRILVWNIDPRTRRDDLAVPLNESGTGVGQVLAILHVAVLSRQSQIIAIDEPQSFLHPGAVRALLEILREQSHHQFLITTHSPVAITAARPDALIHVKTDGEGVSTVAQLDAGETDDLKLLLADLGVRMEDVFGYDNILWVEGRTEELCIPLILKLVGQPLARMGIFGLVATGDLEGRHKELAFDVYNRLSEGSVLMPPAVAFIFDRERRTDARVKDIIDRGGGRVHFLPFRMFENYLLQPDAIAAVAASIEGFGPVTSQTVEAWLDEHRWDANLFAPGNPPEQRTVESWVENVSGANVLGRLFTALSETRVTYDKVKHGVALTQWLNDSRPETLRPLADFLAARVR